MVIAAFLLGANISSVQADELQDLRNQMAELENEMRQERENQAGVSYEQMQEFIKTCARRHPGKPKEITKCAQDMENRAQSPESNPSLSNRSSIGTTQGATSTQAARPASGRPSPNDGWEEMVTTQSGRQCIQGTHLDSEYKTASEQHCIHKTEYGACMDIEYRFQLKNVCNGALEVKYIYESNRNYWSHRTIPAGGEYIATCRKSLENCSGEIQFAVREPR